MKKARTFYYVYFILLFTISTSAWSQNKNNIQKNTAQLSDLALADQLPVDPDVRIGKLKNGLTYYIRKNDRPDNKVELRLAVNAGSILEKENQLGLAHFMEHMAFNGTKNFEKNELISYLQSVGVKFGMHLNAYTSFDETVYILPIPSDSAIVLQKGLQILQDWAQNVTMDPEEVDKERGIVVEEWRRGRGPEQRMQEQYLPVILKNSRYAERLPIGKKEILENFSYETLRRFYQDWYRPNLMAVIAVGDIDPDAMEKMIKEHFGTIKNPANAPKREEFDIPDHEETLVSIVTDPEASFTQVRLYYKLPAEEEETLEDYREFLKQQLFSGMINRRLAELQNQAQPPFIYGASYYGDFLARSRSAYQSVAAVSEDGLMEGFTALVRENQRVKQHGFTESEMERYKMELLTNYERSYNERNKTESKAYANEYVRNFLQKEPIPGIAFEYAFAQKYLPSITVEEVSKLADRWIIDKNRVIVVTAPEKEEVQLPDEEQLLAVLNDIKNENLEPYVDELKTTALMENPPAPGKVEGVKQYESLGVTEMTLSNGVKVVMKPTDFKNDQILMKAFSPGGTSVYPLEDYHSAEWASNIVQESGVKDLSTTDLDKLLAGKQVSVSPYISDLEEGFSGSSTPRDLETMFQLVHLYATEPRKDETSFQSFVNKYKPYFKNLLSNPNYYYSDKVAKIMSQNHPRGGGVPRVEDIEAIQFDKAYEIYNERFADASDFTFFLVGNFEVDSIKPLLETYLGSLPSTFRNDEWRDLGIRPPDGLVDEKVFKGTEPISTVTIKFTQPAPYDREKAYYFNSLADVVNIKLVEKLREEKSGAYSVGANASASMFPYEHYDFNIGFPCAPENVDDLTKAAFEIIGDIQKNGPVQIDVQKVKETQRRQREENLKQNNYWLNALESYYERGIPLDKFDEYESLIGSLTADKIKQTANSLINLDEYIRVVLYPENYKAQ